MVSVLGRCACGGSHAEPNFECERCRLVWTVLLAKKTREFQQAVIKTGERIHLRKAQDLEKRLDAAIAKLTAQQPDLFDGS